MSFLAYPSYKDTGVEWLGEVPSHWTPTRLRFLAQLNPSKAEVGELDPKTEISFVPMEAVGERGELSLDQTRPLGEVLTGYTYFREGDVCIAKITPCFENGKGAIMRGLLGAVGFGTTEFIVARARPDATNSAFLDWLFRSPAFRSRGEAAMFGAGGQKRVPDNFVRDFISPGAPFNEQVAIATFLDRETGKIDALIEEQQHLVALLKEKRQAVIFNAATKGFSPDVPMKDSGIEWLGKVPAHWRVRKLTAVARIESGHTPSRQRPDYWVEEECVIPWFTLADVSQLRSGRSPRVVATTQHISQIGMANSAARLLPAGTVILSRTASVGFAGVIDIDLAVSQDFAAWICGSELYAEFLLIVLQAMRQEFARLMMGSTHQTIYMPDIEAFRIPLPTFEEQAEITAKVQTSLRSLDALDDACQASISLLRERRAAVISAAVTGRIDVRVTAKMLPFPIDRTRARGLIAAEIIERSAHQATFGRVKLQKIAFLAEAHVGVSELAGSYTREAAGPLDRAMIDEMESGARSIVGVTVDQVGGAGTTVSYRLGKHRGAHRNELADWLGADRTAKLDKLIADFAALTTRGAEAVTTLYGVWNDALIDGASPADADIISGFLNDWHPEKRKKFRASELPEWLDWMRRHDIVPIGSSPRTIKARLFA